MVPLDNQFLSSWTNGPKNLVSLDKWSPTNLVPIFPNHHSMSPDFLERHIKIKSYQPFWCWHFLITHEFGQIFSSVTLKVCCSSKPLGYQTKKSSLWHKYPELGFFKKKTEIKTILNPKIKELKDFSQQTDECFLSISRLAGLGTQQTVEYITQL